MAEKKINAANYRIGKKKYYLITHANMIAGGREDEAIELLMKQAKISEEEAIAVIEDLKEYNRQMEEEKANQKEKKKNPLVTVLTVVVLLVACYFAYDTFVKVDKVDESMKPLLAESFEYGRLGEYEDATLTVARDVMALQEKGVSVAIDTEYPTPLGALIYKNNSGNAAFLVATPSNTPDVPVYRDLDGSVYADDGLPAFVREENGYAMASENEFDVTAMTREDFEEELQQIVETEDFGVENLINYSWEAAYNILNLNPRSAGKVARRYQINPFVRANDCSWSKAYSKYKITTKVNSIEFSGAVIAEIDYENSYGRPLLSDVNNPSHTGFMSKVVGGENYNIGIDSTIACLYKVNTTTTEMEGDVKGLNFIPRKGETKDVYVVVAFAVQNNGKLKGIGGVAPLYDEDIAANSTIVNPIYIESIYRKYLTMDYMMD